MPDEAEQRVSNLSRAYRVNLTVLALVALFVGAFLVFSVVSLSVAQRTPAFALLGVLGLTAGERRRLVLAECAAAGRRRQRARAWLLGAAWPPRRCAFWPVTWAAATSPACTAAAAGPGPRLAFALLGTATAVAGGWLPARQAEAAGAGAGAEGPGRPGRRRRRLAGPGAAGRRRAAAGALLPPLGGVPLAAYAAVAALLFGGVALVPAVVQRCWVATAASAAALVLLARRAHASSARTASAAVAGVVASLALSVALTVMVASFRRRRHRPGWTSVLPADLYARSAGSRQRPTKPGCRPRFRLTRAAAVPGVQRVQALPRAHAWPLAPGRPSGERSSRSPWPTPLAAAVASKPGRCRRRPGEIGVYVSEAMVALYGAAPGSCCDLPLGGAVRARCGCWASGATTRASSAASPSTMPTTAA
jgi:putative ABC transport system permease protein